MSGRWWREDRPVFWIHNGWEWGWLGNGWNRLALGKIAIYFKSGEWHLGSNQGAAQTAPGGIGRQSTRFAGGSRQANPGDRARTSARSDFPDGHRKDTA